MSILIGLVGPDPNKSGYGFKIIGQFQSSLSHPIIYGGIPLDIAMYFALCLIFIHSI